MAHLGRGQKGKGKEEAKKKENEIRVTPNRHLSSSWHPNPSPRVRCLSIGQLVCVSQLTVVRRSKAEPACEVAAEPALPYLKFRVILVATLDRLQIGAVVTDEFVVRSYLRRCILFTVTTTAEVKLLASAKQTETQHKANKRISAVAMGPGSLPGACAVAHA
jgi:hypothetical protein